MWTLKMLMQILVKSSVFPGSEIELQQRFSCLTLCKRFLNLYGICHLISYVEVFCSFFVLFWYFFLGAAFVLVSQLVGIVFA